MKTKLLLIICYFLFNLSCWGESGTISNPQALMMGARFATLGGSPAILGDINGMLINPASLSDIQNIPISLTSQTLMNNFNYVILSAGLPYYVTYNSNNQKKSKKIGLGFSFANISLNGIPKTTLYNEFPYQTGSYSAGYYLAEISAGTSFYEIFNFNQLAVGAGFKILQQYVDESTASTFGIDLGAIGTRYINSNIIPKIQFGAVAQNLISPGMTFEDTSNEAIVPLSIYFGGKASLFESQRSSLLLTNNDRGLTLGIESELQDDLIFRSSVTNTAYNTTEVNMGTGIILQNIPTGIPNYNIKLRVDLNYTQHAAPMDSDPSYMFSISSLGRNIPPQPQILYPKETIFLTSKKSTLLSGIGPPNSTIRIYNNDNFFQTTLTDKKGQWRVPQLRLKEGENLLYIQTYDLEKDFSTKSNEVIAISDTTPPELDIQILPDESILNIKIKSNEMLSNITASINDKKVRLRKKEDPKEKETNEEESEVDKIYLKPTMYEGKVALPDSFKENAKAPKDMNMLSVIATDESRNMKETTNIPFFGTINFPSDKHVHYKKNLLVIGNASDMLKSIYVNNNIVYIDDQKRFSIPVDLKPGKNLIKTSFEALNNKVLNFTTRVLHLVSYPDMNSKVKGRREIEFLSTLGVLVGDDDGNFYPTKDVTRQFITKLIVLAMDEEIEDSVSFDLFNDVPSTHPYAPYIQAAINKGLMFAFPDGTFRPDQPLTLSEAIYLLSNAGIINFSEVDETDTYVTRAELAEFLAYTPKYERRIERLINWETGYYDQ